MLKIVSTACSTALLSYPLTLNVNLLNHKVIIYSSLIIVSIKKVTSKNVHVVSKDIVLWMDGVAHYSFSLIIIDH